MHYKFALLFVVIFCANHSIALLDGLIPITSKEELKFVEKLLQSSLIELSTQPNGVRLTFLGIHAVLGQVVAGQRFLVLGSFAKHPEVSIICKVDILHQSWNRYTHSKYLCSDQSEYETITVSSSKRSLL